MSRIRNTSAQRQTCPKTGSGSNGRITSQKIEDRASNARPGTRSSVVREETVNKQTNGCT